jgi:membrane protease YdiL (CAAX protease family)
MKMFGWSGWSSASGFISMRRMRDDRVPALKGFFFRACLFEGGFGVFAYAIGALFGLPIVTWIVWDLLHFAVGLVSVAAPLALLFWTLQSRLAVFLDHRRVVDRLILPLFKGFSIWQLALLSALAGFGEEAFFRGLVQPWIAGMTDPIAALIGAAVIFGLMHALTPTYAFVATLIGLFLGGLWLATDNMLAPMTTHGVYDFIALVYYTRMYRPERVEESEPLA